MKDIKTLLLYPKSSSQIDAKYARAIAYLRLPDLDKGIKEIKELINLDRNDPFEKYINEIYKSEICVSPLKSLSVHFTNVNSSYGLSPFIDYKKLWEENE